MFLHIVFNIYNIFLRFADKFHENCGWVVKSPFNTNSHYVKFYQMDDFDKMVLSLKRLHEDKIVGFSTIPYVMIQPCMYNRKEYKVICLENRAAYIADISGAGMLYYFH